MPSKQLFIIRIALMAGVFTFAGITLLQRSQGTAMTIESPLNIGTMRYVLWALVAASMLVTLVLQGQVQSAPHNKRGLLTLIGWSFGEGVALFGIILHFIGGPVATLAIGVVGFVFSLLLLPVPRESR
jgi:FtsH-binding integral membrane protein